MQVMVENLYEKDETEPRSEVKVHCRMVNDTKFKSIVPKDPNDPDCVNWEVFDETDTIVFYVEQHGDRIPRGRLRGVVSVDFWDSSWGSGPTFTCGKIVSGFYREDTGETTLTIKLIGSMGDFTGSPSSVNVSIGPDLP